MTLRAGRMNHRTTPVANISTDTVGFWEGLKAAFKIMSKEERREAAMRKRTPLALVAISKARTQWPANAKTEVKRPSLDSDWAQEEELSRRMYEELETLYAKN